MRFFVAGASGLLGATLVPALETAGHQVTAHGNRRGRDITADLTDPEAAKKALGQAQADIIINLVALADVDRCETHPAEAEALNITVVENLARAANGAFLIQISTDQVYDGPGPHAEDNANLTNAYARTKKAGEEVALRSGGIALRTNFFGHSRHPSRRTLNEWVEAQARSHQPFTGFDDVLFSPLTMTSLAALIIRIAQVRRPGLYNLGSRDGCSKADFAVAIAKQLGLSTAAMQRGSRLARPAPAYRPGDMRMDVRRFETDFGIALPRLADEIASLRNAP